MKVGLISDTHGKLRAEVFHHFEGIDLILHAGDIGSYEIVTELEAVAPVHAVAGNTDDGDVAARVGAEQRLDLVGWRTVLVHGHRLGTPTPARLRDAYPDADLVVYGHTHRPLLDDGAAPLLINPGAAGAARFGLPPSIGILELGDGGPTQGSGRSLSYRRIDLDTDRG